MVKQGVGRELGFKNNHCIEEARLIGESDGLRGIERRAACDTAQRGEARRRRNERGLRGAGGAGEIRTHSDVCREHLVNLRRRVPATRILSLRKAGEGTWLPMLQVRRTKSRK
jgi:hypothetical protein